MFFANAAALMALMAFGGIAQARSVTDDDTLTRAVRANDVAAAQAALARKADPNQRLAFGATPLSWSVDTQNPEMVGVLLASHAAPDTVDSDGITPLSLACERGNAAIVAMLLDRRADVRIARPDGTTPLAICARYGPAEAVARMLVAGARPDSLDDRGQTPLMWAAASGQISAIALLVKAGADVNRVSKGGFTSLFFAIKSGVPAATQALLAAGANADYRGPENTSAAQIAVYQHNYGAAALLVDRGASVTERDRTGYQLLHGAAEGGDPALIAALLNKGSDPNALTGPSRIKWVTEANFGRPPPPVPPTPPLLLAAMNGHQPAMKMLLDAGADPRFVAENGTNIVLAAAQSGSAAALEFALALSPNANFANPDGATALHMLLGGPARPELKAMLQTLAAHGARTDMKDKRGITPAAMALTALTEVTAAYIATFQTAAAPGKTVATSAPPSQ